MIVQLPQPSPPPVEPAQPVSRKGPENAGSDGFDELLSRMLEGLPSKTRDKVAAAITPRIGASAKAFGEASLLVQTAVDFLQVQLRGSIAEGLSAALPPQHSACWPLQADKAAVEGPAPHGADAWTASLRSLWQAAAIHRAPAGAGQGAGSIPIQHQPAAGSPSAALEREPASDPVEVSPFPERTGHAGRPTSGDGRANRFAAQLMAAENGLRLLLKLPRLDDGERKELEARVARLMEGFGHRQHELVIRQIEGG